MSEDARKAFACPSASGTLDDIDLALLDRDDEDQRRILIEAEHPELKEALDEGIKEVHHGTEVVSRSPAHSDARDRHEPALGGRPT
ncbi:MAG: hypothetical protein ACLQVK_22575 [Acidimicrobiales bacterium]|jgi:hypothetical protein